MKLDVDAELCVGHGQCYLVAPDLLGPDEDGFVDRRRLPVEVSADQGANALGAVRVCPERAVTLT